MLSGGGDEVLSEMRLKLLFVLFACKKSGGVGREQIMLGVFWAGAVMCISHV